MFVTFLNIQMPFLEGLLFLIMSRVTLDGQVKWRPPCLSEENGIRNGYKRDE